MKTSEYDYPDGKFVNWQKVLCIKLWMTVYNVFFKMIVIFISSYHMIVK